MSQIAARRAASYIGAGPNTADFLALAFRFYFGFVFRFRLIALHAQRRESEFTRGVT